MDKSFEFVGFEKNLEAGEFVFKYKLTTSKETFSFEETLTLPNTQFDKVPEELLNGILNSLLLILGISYWKLYCPKEIKLNIPLTSQQAEFWNSVYINGLGEFFFRNKIDFSEFNLFSPSIENVEPVKFIREEKYLLAVGGGKDSIVSGEMLKKESKKFTAFTLGEHEIQNRIVELFEVDKITILRKIDPKLLELNKREDAYNGHIPISAIYHFVGILAAALYNFKYVIFSNEASANYGNVEYLGKEINHQWSKSQEFELLIQEYTENFITPDIIPYSLLRDMHEIKIVEIFSKYPKYFPFFSSCNRNFRIAGGGISTLWCGECAKCLFMFAMLSAFLTKKEVVKIFGQSLFDKEELGTKYEELLGKRDHKPFDCVGTPEEVRLAFYLAHEKREYKDSPIMKMFESEFSKDFDNIIESKESFL